MNKTYYADSQSDMKRLQRNIMKKINAIVKERDTSLKRQAENLTRDENSQTLFYNGPGKLFAYEPSDKSVPYYFRKVRCPKCFRVTGITSGICAWCGCQIKVTEHTQFLD